jgi:Mg/Co/Ni transporter MgtE
MINDTEDFSDEEFEEGDYGFIIDPNGNLKGIIYPEDLMEDPPKTVKKILKIFNIANIHTIPDRTLH